MLRRRFVPDNLSAREFRGRELGQFGHEIERLAWVWLYVGRRVAICNGRQPFADVFGVVL
jgi:hypothetical protein